VELANYRAAARTYRRPLILFAAVPVPVWIISLVIAWQMQGLPTGGGLNAPEDILRETRSLDRHIAFTMLTIPTAALLICAGAVLSVYLKEMLGNSTSRLVPNLQRTHLTLAALFTATFTVLVPIVAASTVDLGMSTATAVALSLALFASAAFIVHWFPYALPPVIAIASFFFGLALNGSRTSWSLSPATTWGLIIVSLGGLTWIGLRLARLHEEMFEYHRRWKAEPRDSRGFAWFFPSGDMRLGKRAGSPVADTLLGRARRWHAAWRTMWVAVGLGLFVGGMLGVMAHLNKFSIPELVGSPNVAYIAIFPVVTLVGLGPSRRYLIEELVRPPSRREHVQAVGLALAMVVLVGWLLIEVAGVLVILIWGHAGASMAGIWESAAFSLCCLPVLFGAAVWPYRTSLVFFAYSAMFGVMASFFLTPLKLSGSELTWAAAAILFVGLLMTRASYLRWLNHDPVPGSAIFGTRELDGGWNRGFTMQKLRKG
jgi:hypothetical protein